MSSAGGAITFYYCKLHSEDCHIEIHCVGACSSVLHVIQYTLDFFANTSSKQWYNSGTLSCSLTFQESSHLLVKILIFFVVTVSFM